MIREYAPIALIPAAWILTFLTVVYPGISTYWIQHMHYFMLPFLVGFTVLSWKQMEKDSVLDIWRKVIGLGTVFTGFGTLSFFVSMYSQLMASFGLAYWFVAPGVALYYSSKKMDKYSELFKRLGVLSVISLLVLGAGIYSELQVVQAVGLVGVAVSQTVSIVIASKLDS